MYGNNKILVLFTALFIFSLYSTIAQPILKLETGIVSTGYNNVQIPAKGGTLLSLKSDLNTSAGIYYRIRFMFNFGESHRISVLYAPLKTKASGQVANETIFTDVIFPPHSEIESTYKFNSYRLTYQYAFLKNNAFDLALGITAKIRDASIKLEADSLIEEYTNIGFVPLINFKLAYVHKSKVGLLFEGDALAVKQGRAEDVLVALTYQKSDNLSFITGYRILEGGTDGSAVHTFALFHYFVLGVDITF